MIYLDANATETLRPEARAAALEAMDLTGNPASVHGCGREARRMLERARLALATLLACAPRQVVFTSGGTEANALGVEGALRARPDLARTLAGATEHDAVRAAAPGHGILRVEASGRLDLGALQAALASGPPALVCLMLANNETGVIHPIAEAAALCRAHGAWLHVDAVQGPGRLPVSLRSLGAHSLAISGHKIGGPKGAGALLLADEVEIAPVIQGGGQELGRRGGTPPLPAIAGMAAALEAAEGARSLADLRDQAEAAAVACGAIVCGASERLGNTTCLALPGCRADMQVIKLDLLGIAVSAGAACSSGKVTRSHVLDAMGLGDLAGCAIRVSLPWNVSASDIETFCVAYREVASSASPSVKPRGETSCPSG